MFSSLDRLCEYTVFMETDVRFFAVIFLALFWMSCTGRGAKSYDTCQADFATMYRSMIYVRADICTEHAFGMAMC